MRVISFFIGIVLGLVGGATGMLLLQERNRAAATDEIMLQQKFFYSTDAFVNVSGTLTGKGLAYQNNTYSMGCYRDQKQCWLTYIEQIGPNQIGRMDAPYAYEIKQWSTREIVAGDEGTFGCFKTTITINRDLKELLWVQEPVNQTQSLCKDADTSIRKYTIEDFPRQRALKNAIGNR